jgi:hypothetical protein
MIRVLLLVLAVARATRFVTTDWLGHWLLVQPARNWAAPYEGIAERDARMAWQSQHTETSQYLLADGTWSPDWEKGFQFAYDQEAPLSRQGKLVKGLDCPYCVGFWIGGLALLGELTIARLPIVGTVWRFGTAWFALNYVTAHLNAKLD